MAGWVDEALGWHTGGDASGRETPSGAMTPGLPPHDAPDYEEVSFSLSLSLRREHWGKDRLLTRDVGLGQVVHLLAKHQGEDE